MFYFFFLLKFWSWENQCSGWETQKNWSDSDRIAFLGSSRLYNCFSEKIGRKFVRRDSTLVEMSLFQAALRDRHHTTEFLNVWRESLLKVISILEQHRKPCGKIFFVWNWCFNRVQNSFAGSDTSIIPGLLAKRSLVKANLFLKSFRDTNGKLSPQQIPHQRFYAFQTKLSKQWVYLQWDVNLRWDGCVGCFQTIALQIFLNWKNW